MLAGFDIGKGMGRFFNRVWDFTEEYLIGRDTSGQYRAPSEQHQDAISLSVRSDGVVTFDLGGVEVRSDGNIGYDFHGMTFSGDGSVDMKLGDTEFNTHGGIDFKI